MSAVEEKNAMATLTDSKLDGKMPAMDFEFPGREDEHSSDEESFHLPIDDEEVEKLDDSMETEEALLNKEDKTAANDDVIDQALEDSLLAEPADKPETDSATPVLSESSKDKSECSENGAVDSSQTLNESTAAEKTEGDNAQSAEVSNETSDNSDKVHSPSSEVAEVAQPTSKDETETDTATKSELAQNTESAQDESVNKSETDTEEDKDTPVAKPSSPAQEEEPKDADSSEKSDVEKCENSNDGSKCSPLEQDDLLDISIIRGVEEDDENAREELNKDKELQDNEEESIDKASDDDDNDVKGEDQMDFENGDCTVLENDKGDEDSMTVKDEEIKEDSGKENENPEDEDNSKDGSIKSGKRSLGDSDFDTNAKKMKFSSNVQDDTSNQPAVEVEIEKPKVLASFASYMRDKKRPGKLTMANLEEFCLQKVCEGILHRTEVGELHQKIKNYETTIDALKRDVSQLSKQARDLEIVNRKLMNELKLQNGANKPLVPLKITRSVGLQVKLNGPQDAAGPLRRRSGGTAQSPVQQRQEPATPVQSKTNSQSGIPVASKAVIRQVSLSPQKPAPLLTQALAVQKRKPGPKPHTPPQKRATPQLIKPKEQPKASVIDLTDEDDRAAKGKVVQKAVPLSQMKTVTVSQNKTIHVGGNKTITLNQTKTIPLMQQQPGTPTRTVPGSVRLTPTQLKNGSITLPAGVVSSSAPQLMYVVQPTSTLSGGLVTSTTGTQKAVLVNFQTSPNGVLAAPLNGTALPIIASKSPVQAKPLARRHPAPLPSPPIVYVKDHTTLKPVPPKPHLSIRKTENGIILQWKMPYSLDKYEAIASYQLYAYQETKAPPSTNMWRRVGDVKALALPMACTLTQFADKNRYYFAVRSVDIHKRIGVFSDPEEISL